MIMEGHTQQEIAKNLGVSRQRISYMIKKIRHKTQEMFNRGLHIC
jgi:DNA-directed RNA polymerase specialized sigma subunit